MSMLLYSTILGSAVVIGSGVILRASWHDLRATAQRSRLAAAQRRLRGIRQLRVAVLIDVGDALLEALAACLNSVVKNRYYQLAICVVDNQQTAAIKQFLQTYRQLHPSTPVRYYAPRRPLSQTDGLRSAYRRLLKHDLVLTLDARDTISPTFIKQAVAHFSDNQQLARLQFTHHSQFAPSLTSLLMRYGEVGSEILQKATLHLPHRKLLRASTGIMYRHSYFMANAQNSARKTRYDATLIITTHGLMPIKSPHYPLLSWLLSTLSTYLLTFVFVVAATLQNSSLLILTWLSICIWTLVALWTENATSPREKFILTYGVLLAPLLLYLRLIWLTATLPIHRLRWLMHQRHRTRHNTNRHRYQRYVLDNILALKAGYEEMCPREVWYQDQRRTDD